MPKPIMIFHEIIRDVVEFSRKFKLFTQKIYNSAKLLQKKMYRAELCKPWIRLELEWFIRIWLKGLSLHWRIALQGV
jgi:hypothetical protein